MDVAVSRLHGGGEIQPPLLPPARSWRYSPGGNRVSTQAAERTISLAAVV
jgi:hypothetical protein